LRNRVFSPVATGTFRNQRDQFRVDARFTVQERDIVGSQIGVRNNILHEGLNRIHDFFKLGKPASVTDCEVH